MIPKKGDKFFEGFEDEYVPGESELLTISEVDDRGTFDEKHQVGGWEVACEETNTWYDCFWSEKHQTFVYGLGDGS